MSGDYVGAADHFDPTQGPVGYDPEFQAQLEWEIIDITGDGLIDAISATLPSGETFVLYDTVDDNDRAIDGAFIKAPSGETISITAQGQGFLIQVDQNGDGIYEERHTISYQEMEAAIPEVARVFGLDLEAVVAELTAGEAQAPPTQLFVPETRYADGGYWAGTPQHDLFGGDGVADAVEVTMTWDNVSYRAWAVDATGDYVADFIAIDTDGDGYAETIFHPDGHGGWTLLSVPTEQSVDTTVQPDSIQPTNVDNQGTVPDEPSIYNSQSPPIRPISQHTNLMVVTAEQGRVALTEMAMMYWDAWFTHLGQYPTGPDGYAMDPMAALQIMLKNGSHLTQQQVDDLTQISRSNNRMVEIAIRGY